jgi:hypothetical protein
LFKDETHVIAPRCLLFASLLLPAPLCAEENRYDVLGKCLTPILAVMAKDRQTESRALTLRVRLEQGTDIPAEFRGAKAEITFQSPDRLKLSGPLFGREFTLARYRERVWIHPAGPARALLDATEQGASLPPPEKKFKLADFELPIPEKQLAFISVLFDVKDLGFDEVDGVECRALDLRLMPALADSLKSKGWAARLWVKPDYKPARITLARKGWHIVLRIDELLISGKLPGATWQPTAEQAAETLDLTPKDYSRFLRAIGGIVE